MDADGIIATSPMIERDTTTLAHRIVIRELPSHQYVVHMQIFEDNKHYFHQGNYFTFEYKLCAGRPTREQALAKAWECFERRARMTMNLPYYPERAAS